MKANIEFINLKKQYAELKTEINNRVQTVFDHGQYIMGPEVAELEAALSDYTGAKEVITVASGTEALLISLMALGVGPGDEVITTPFTFAATAEVIALVGATPVFVDIDSQTCNIDPAKIESAISLKTKAIIPVSLYGQPADMATINAIAARHGDIPVIEDAAQSFGAMYRGKRSCNLSTIGCTSFFPSKPLGCYGDGGAIFTNDARLAKIMRELRVHGQEHRYYHARVGVGGRMDTIQCAIVLAKLNQFDWELAQRQNFGARYQDHLRNIPGIELVAELPDASCVYGQFTILVNDREHVIDVLKQYGVPTAVHYPIPLHEQPAYKTISRISGDLLNAKAASRRVLSLPMHPYLTYEDQDYIISVVRNSILSPSGINITEEIVV